MSEIACYEYDFCLHKDMLCAACKGNMDVKDPPVDFFEHMDSEKGLKK